MSWITIICVKIRMELKNRCLISNKQSGMVKKQSGTVKKQSGTVTKQSGTVKKTTGMVKNWSGNEGNDCFLKDFVYGYKFNYFYKFNIIH